MIKFKSFFKPFSLPLSNRRGFTFVEVAAVVIILAIVAVFVVPKYVSFREQAAESNVQSFRSSLLAAIHNARLIWALAGQPANTAWVPINNCEARYRAGWIRNVRNSNHVPAGVPNRNRQSTRLWYLLLEAPPTPIAAASTESGWVMLANNCAGARTRCWEYRLDGVRFQAINYYFNTGDLVIAP